MTKTVYEHFDTATQSVSAYTIMAKDTGEYLGRVVVKFPRDGSGRVQAFLHIWQLPMVRGIASGWGYDKASAAVRQAAHKQLAALENPKDPDGLTARTDDHFRSIRSHALTICHMIDDQPDGFKWLTALEREDSPYRLCAVI